MWFMRKLFSVIYNISKIILCFQAKVKTNFEAIFSIIFIYRTCVKNIMQATKEFCGKCIAVPLVKLAVETYSPPDFPPKLQWYEFQPRKDCTGSILAAFELIEVSYIDFFSRQILYTRCPAAVVSLPFLSIYFIFDIYYLLLFFNFLREAHIRQNVCVYYCTDGEQGDFWRSTGHTSGG